MSGFCVGSGTARVCGVWSVKTSRAPCLPEGWAGSSAAEPSPRSLYPPPEGSRNVRCILHPASSPLRPPASLEAPLSLSSAQDSGLESPAGLRAQSPEHWRAIVSGSVRTGFYGKRPPGKESEPQEGPSFGLEVPFGVASAPAGERPLGAGSLRPAAHA